MLTDILAAPLSLNELSVTLAKSEASTRWIVDAIALNAYKVATLDVKNTQPLNVCVRCESAYNFGPVMRKRG